MVRFEAYLKRMTCRLYRTLAVDPYDAVLVGLCHALQLPEVGQDELWPALAKDAEHLGRFHPHLIVPVVQELLKDGQMLGVNVGRVRGDVLGCPDKGCLTFASLSSARRKRSSQYGSIA